MFISSNCCCIYFRSHGNLERDGFPGPLGLSRGKGPQESLRAAVEMLCVSVSTPQCLLETLLLCLICVLPRGEGGTRERACPGGERRISCIIYTVRLRGERAVREREAEQVFRRATPLVPTSYLKFFLGLAREEVNYLPVLSFLLNYLPL